MYILQHYVSSIIHLRTASKKNHVKKNEKLMQEHNLAHKALINSWELNTIVLVQQEEL